MRARWRGGALSVRTSGGARDVRVLLARSLPSLLVVRCIPCGGGESLRVDCGRLELCSRQPHVLSNPSCSTLRASLASHGAPISHMGAHDVSHHARLALGAALAYDGVVLPLAYGAVHAFAYVRRLHSVTHILSFSSKSPLSRNPSHFLNVAPPP